MVEPLPSGHSPSGCGRRRVVPGTWRRRDHGVVPSAAVSREAVLDRAAVAIVPEQADTVFLGKGGQVS